MNMTEQIFRVVIPEEEETQVKDGKAKKQLKKRSLVMYLQNQ